MIATTLFVLLTLGVVPIVASAARAGQIHIPITRRLNKGRGLHHLAEAADNLRAKYKFPTVLSSRKRAGSTAAVPITNLDGDVTYVGAINIGTPAQQFNVALDSGSSDLWLANTQCTLCPLGTPAYDSSKSSSFASPGNNGPVNIRYGSGSITGLLAQDTVTMAGYNVSNQTFLSVDDVEGNLIVDATAGFMGLAFQSLSRTEALPFWQALVQSNQFSSPQMSFWLTRYLNDTDAQTTEPGGVLTLGGTNTTLYTGDIQFLDMANSSELTYWLLQLRNITVQGKNVQIAAGNAAIDTGTTLIGGPSADVQNIWAAVPNSQPMDGSLQGFYGFPCSTAVQISLSFGGNTWPISAADMNNGIAGDNPEQCVGSIFDLGQVSSAGSMGGNPDWIIGDTFLKNVYTVLRSSPPSIGFAELSAAAGSSSVAASSSSTLGSGTAHASNPSATGTSGPPRSDAISVHTGIMKAIPTPLLLALVTCIIVLN